MVEQTDEEFIAEIAALAEKATGLPVLPWEARNGDVYFDGERVAKDCWAADAAFIAESRTAIPRLIGIIERLEREVWLLTHGTQGTWRCFQCDQVFTARKEAERHFGHWPGDKPLCCNEHADDQMYWRDRYNALEAKSHELSKLDFKRWQDSESKLDAALAKVERLTEMLRLVEIKQPDGEGHVWASFTTPHRQSGAFNLGSADKFATKVALEFERLRCAALTSKE